MGVKATLRTLLRSATLPHVGLPQQICTWTHSQYKDLARRVIGKTWKSSSESVSSTSFRLLGFAVLPTAFPDAFLGVRTSAFAGLFGFCADFWDKLWFARPWLAVFLSSGKYLLFFRSGSSTCRPDTQKRAALCALSAAFVRGIGTYGT